ncbi:DUF6470 family protein [Alkalibacillus salilacus]|uniref:Uncharacterized protein n=1 Tax=Alkalibacillus salilacus TaxID=284582 RepID=A0ABT9VFB1_9BACI|nr:DUF6470 family protein [Alkalibacillus salilacus]MDQ0159656.1 hypothetical protein [Alkalibacillus salilacus]
MQLPPISYTIQRGQIGIDTQDAQLDITQQDADLQISQPEADLNIETTPSKLTIDQTEALRDMGIISAEESARQNAQEGRQTAQEGIARRASEGDEMMKIENGTDAIQNIVERNIPNPRQDFNIGWIPSSHFAVDINYQPAEVNIEATPNEPIINATPNKPQLNYQRGDVNTSLAQEPHFDINVDMESWRQSQYDYKI